MKTLPIQPMENESFPHDLHKRIMWRITYARLRTPILLIAVLLVVNLMTALWRTSTIIIERDTITVLQSLYENIQINADLATDFMQQLGPFVPLHWISTVMVDITLLFSLWYLSHAVKRSLNPS